MSGTVGISSDDRKRIIWIWTCCQCGGGPYLKSLHRSCDEWRSGWTCEHRRCSECPLFEDRLVLQANHRKGEQEEEQKGEHKPEQESVEVTRMAADLSKMMETSWRKQAETNVASMAAQRRRERSTAHASDKEKASSEAGRARESVGVDDSCPTRDASASYTVSSSLSASNRRQEWAHHEQTEQNTMLLESSTTTNPSAEDSTRSEHRFFTDQEICNVDTPISSLHSETQDNHLDMSGAHLPELAEGSPRTLKDILVFCLVHMIPKSLHRYLHGESISDAENDNSDNNALAPQHRNPSSDVSTTGSSISKRKERDNDEHSSNNRNGGRRGRNKPRQPEIRSISALCGRPFACHFCKRRPHVYQGRRWKNCLGPGPGWLEVHRVKQHILDHHKLRPRCERCGDEFDTHAHVSQHLQNEAECPRRRLITNEGVSLDMQGRLKDRTGLCKMTAEEKWIHWYKVLFPDDDFELMPSPYYEPNVSTISAYDDFFKHDFLTELQAEFEREMPEKIRETIPQLMPELRAFLISTVRRVHNRFAENQDSNVRATDTPDPAREQTKSKSPEQMPNERVVTPAMGAMQQTMGVAEMDDVWQSSIHDTFAQQLTEDNFMADFDIASWPGDFGELFDSLHQGEPM